MSAIADDRWRPLFEDDGEAAESYDALAEGVPAWLMPSLTTWLGGIVNNDETLHFIERTLRWQIDWNVVRSRNRLSAVFTAARDNAGVLKLVDLLLAHIVHDATRRNDLQMMLAQAGSAWQVGERGGRFGLIRRVPEGVQEAAESTFSRGDAGRLLRQAWGSVFGVDPNPSEAYRLAVKSVEAAAIPVVSPAATRATLGTVIAQMESQGDWCLPFEREHTASPTFDVLLGLLRTLWHGRHDRHAGGDPALPLTVSQAEAEAAVAAAVTLVQWFSSGAVRRS